MSVVAGAAPTHVSHSGLSLEGQQPPGHFLSTWTAGVLRPAQHRHGLQDSACATAPHCLREDQDQGVERYILPSTEPLQGCRCLSYQRVGEIRINNLAYHMQT